MAWQERRNGSRMFVVPWGSDPASTPEDPVHGSSRDRAAYGIEDNEPFHIPAAGAAGGGQGDLAIPARDFDLDRYGVRICCDCHDVLLCC